ncbi:hypothetical protein FB451DRAFT_1089812 [Mycena latifolia]|nr:hypothetical protein FB451DRAFT_1089812 [Mycena latifolia]
MTSSPTISILDFPPEITSVIFVYCVASDSYFDTNELPWLSPYEPPLLLGCICRQWRDVALSTPELWNVLQVECPYFIEEIIPQLDRWLLKARALPLTVDIRYKVHPDTSSDDILRLMKRHSEQLQNITLDISPEDFYRFAGIVGPLPGLRKLVLNSRILGHPIYDGSYISAFNAAPQLRDVHFISGFSTKNIALPWGQLTTFRADTLPTSQFLHVLLLAPNLVSCRLEIYHATNVFVSVPPLLYLTSLIVRGMVPSTDLLAQLTTPALVHLEVEDLELDRWVAFLARSGCALQYLAVATKGWTPAMYAQGLDGVPSVTELVGRRGGPSFYNLIGLLNDCPRFMPNLKIFIEDQNYCLIHWPTLTNGLKLCELVIGMLEFRRSSTENARLERFELHTTNGLAGSAQLLGRLDTLIEAGMEISVEGSKSWGR